MEHVLRGNVYPAVGVVAVSREEVHVKVRDRIPVDGLIHLDGPGD
jgi:hypothetical protein